MSIFTIFLPDDNATTALGLKLAPVLQVGDCLLLSGDIGAGKTALCRAIIHGRLNRLEDVPSPTFTIVQTYEATDGDIWHCDLYRLASPDDALELGLDDAFENAICLIEWPDRLGSETPKDAANIQLTAEGDGRRVRFDLPDALAQRLVPILSNE